jgi:bifunctional non-homologous end joining protein LigD
MKPAANALETYRTRRDFAQTPEPRGRVGKSKGDSYVIQKHEARRTHFDFRLELDGVLKSWALTRGPSLNPSDKRLAVRTEDHPLGYRKFEGVIPRGYGAGTVMLWDRGRWMPKGDPVRGLRDGVLKFTLFGKRLRGAYALVRMKDTKEKRENWLLVKERDEHADESADPVERWKTSIESARTLGQIADSGIANGEDRPDKGQHRVSIH